MLNYFPEKIMTKILTISVFLTLGMLTSLFPAEKIFCDQCGNLIKQGATYIKHLGKIYCDDECYEKILPKCLVCGKRVRSGYKFGSKSGDFYCVDCSKKPQCFACGLPNDCRELDDGRKVCPECLKTAVVSHREAAETLREVRKMMKDKLGLYTLNEIDYRLVDKLFLEAKSESKAMELGLYSHEQWKNTEIVTKKKLGFKIGEEVRESYTDSFTIYILDHLPKDKFIEIAAHELAHDWMEIKYPEIKDPLISEGWAEYTASLVNILYGNVDMNLRMKNNEDPVYGEGYRLISGIAENGGSSSLMDYFTKENEKAKKASGEDK
jgi:hypothetical protein